MMSQLANINMEELLNAYVSRIPDENPLEYVEKMYSSIHPGMIIEALEEAKRVVNVENSKSKKAKEEAEVYLTLGGESLTRNFYTGVISTLLWLPRYLSSVANNLGIDKRDLETTLNVLNKAQLPKVHDIQEEVIGGNKIEIKPSGVRHYSAFLSSIVSWLNSGVTDFKITGTMKTNIELARYLSAVALESFPSVPFAAYHVGTCKTNDIYELSEKIGKSFDFNKFMSPECFAINEPKFVTTTANAPIVSIVGHPLTDTFIAEVKDANTVKWVGLFIENEEFSKLCVQNGLTPEMIKKYIIDTLPEQHTDKLEKKDPVAMFIENQNIAKQCFELRHKFSTFEKTINEYDV